MGDCNDVHRNKRARVDSEDDSPGPKRVQVDSEAGSTGSSVPEPGQDRVDPDSDSPESRRIRDDLLDILDSPDAVGEREPLVEDLDSVIRSFEEEILVPPQAGDSTTESGETPLALGYLLEASDDALGLPPGFSDAEDGKNMPTELPAMRYDSFGFGDEIPSYDSFGFGVVAESESSNDISNDEAEFVTWGGLFDYSESGYDPSDFPWHPETLPAV